MIAGKSILAVVPARGGSKGIPGKNLRLLGGRPLIAWSIAAARNSRYIDHLVMSSDDSDIIDTATAWGCSSTIRRPAELATDEAPLEGALIHAIDSIEAQFDYLVLLQPTSPFRQSSDIDDTISMCHETGAHACLTVCEPGKSPYWMCHRDSSGRLSPMIPSGPQATRRQDLPPAFALNGAVYIAEVPWFRSRQTFLTDETVGYVMPPERSLDIDSEFDFSIADALVSSGMFAFSEARRS